MNYTRLIHDYIDGALNKNEQDLLFAELFQNAELRNEFNQQLKLHTISQKDMAMISTPVSATNAIFTKLGYSIPSGASVYGQGTAAAGTSKFAPFLLFLKKYTGNVFTAVLSAGLTALILYFILDFGSGNNINSGDLGLNTTQNQSVQQSDIPNISSGELSNLQQVQMSDGQNILNQKQLEDLINGAIANYMNQFQTQYQTLYASINNSAEGLKLISDKLDNYSNDRNITYWPMSYLMLSDDLRRMDNTNNQNPVTLSKTPSSTPDVVSIEPQGPYSSDSRISMSIRGFSNSPNLKLNVPSGSNPWFNNMALGANYNIGKGHSFGVELGQENFPQEFTRTLWGEDLKYKQNPLLFWYGASYKYSMHNFIIPEILYPYIQVFGGATTVGPIGRAQIGLNYKPDSKVTLNLGIEASSLWYNVQGTVYDSKKLGLTYGLSINY